MENNAPAHNKGGGAAVPRGTYHSVVPRRLTSPTTTTSPPTTMNTTPSSIGTTSTAQQQQRQSAITTTGVRRSTPPAMIRLEGTSPTRTPNEVKGSDSRVDPTGPSQASAKPSNVPPVPQRRSASCPSRAEEDTGGVETSIQPRSATSPGDERFPFVTTTPPLAVPSRAAVAVAAEPTPALICGKLIGPAEAQGDLPSNWQYHAPPNNQTTTRFDVPVEFAITGEVTFSSEFDSGNMYKVEQLSPTKYKLFFASDCMNSPFQTSNKNWFHFRVSGFRRGISVTFVLATMPWCRSYTYNYTPCIAIWPMRCGFSRLPGKVTMTPAADPPPQSQMKLHLLTDDGDLFEAPIAAPKKKKSNNPAFVDLVWDYTFEWDREGGGGGPNSDNRSLLVSNQAPPPVYYFCNAHPYSYNRLQRQLANWFPHCRVVDVPSHSPDIVPPPASANSATSAATPPPTTSASAKPPLSSPTTPSVSSTFGCNTGPKRVELEAITINVGGDASRSIYVHRELLSRSLDGNRVDLITLTSSSGMAPLDSRSPHGGREPPYENALADAQCGANAKSIVIPESARFGQPRPRQFPRKKYVVFSARVHPGETPASHVMHGLMEFLLHPTDPRADALRQNFVFLLVPMINPDGVARGHNRADTQGQNLNRMYRSPCPSRNPQIFALRRMLFALHATNRLALYVDLHAHANKKGAFIFGNAMDGPEQVQNVLYTKLIQLNSPYFDFVGCNFSDVNMFAVGKNGDGKDGSARVALFQETGFVHSYTLECNYLAGPPLNPVVGLPSIAGEENEVLGGMNCPRYTPSTFHDVGRALATSLLDLHSLTPAEVSRIARTNFRNTQGVLQWVQRFLMTDAMDQYQRLLNKGPILIEKVALSTPCGTDRGGGQHATPPTSASSASAAYGGALSGFVSGSSSQHVGGPIAQKVTTLISPNFPPTTTLNIWKLFSDKAAVNAAVAERDVERVSPRGSAATVAATAQASGGTATMNGAANALKSARPRAKTTSTAKPAAKRVAAAGPLAPTKNVNSPTSSSPPTKGSGGATDSSIANAGGEGVGAKKGGSGASPASALSKKNFQPQTKR